MPTVYPLTLVPPTRTGSYPHMAKNDRVVWERWLEQFGAGFEAVAYDVALGGSTPPADGIPEAERAGWQYSTALKIDALLFSTEGVVIVEVRPWATVSALGAALTYALVAEREQLTPLPLSAAIVCEGIQPDVLWCAEKLKIQVWRV